MGTPRKHKELIVAWAEGAEIEYRYKDEEAWAKCPIPSWYAHVQYRIKPEPIKTARYKEVLYYNEHRGAWVACITEKHIHLCNNDPEFVRFVDNEWKQEIV